MNIDFLNKKELFVFAFDSKITDKRTGETVETIISWLEPDRTQKCEEHAANRIRQTCDDLGYSIILSNKSEVRKAVLDKNALFESGDFEL